MTLLNKTGVALRLLVAGLTLALVGCATAETPLPVKDGSEYFKRLPPCNPNYAHSNCEMLEVSNYADPVAEWLFRQYEVGIGGIANGLSRRVLQGAQISLTCHDNGRTVASYYFGTLRDISSVSSKAEVEKICEPIRAAMVKARKDEYEYRNASPERKAELRLDACDSFGFERGTDAHAECAMKLYMNEQNQGTANAVTSSNNQQTATVARQQAIQEATIKEQERIRQLEAALRGMQVGIDMMNGTTSSPTPSKTHSQTYNINGQIIRCTTTGSITTCL